MNRRQKIIVSITGIFIVLLALVGLTYAYFLTRITGNSNPTSISVTTKNLELVYGDNSEEIIKGTGALIPTIGTEVEDAIGTKTFTVTNNGNDSSYVVIIDNVETKYATNGSYKDENGNTVTYTKDQKAEFLSNDFRYSLSCTVKDKSGSVLSDERCNDVDSLSIFPIDGGILVGNAIPENKVHEYTLTLWYIDNGDDQSNDMNKRYQARVNIEDINRMENPFKTGNNENDKKSLAYNIIENAKTNKNGTRLVNTPPSKVAQEKTLETGTGKFEYIRVEDAVDEVPVIEFQSAIQEGVFRYSSSPETACNGTVATINDNLSGKYLCTEDIVDFGVYWVEPYDSTTETIIIRGYQKKEIMAYERVLSVTADNYGTSYYYRGDVKDNYVNFAGICWRIVRIEGDGSIKLLLEDAYAECNDNETEVTSTIYTGNWSNGNKSYAFKFDNSKGYLEIDYLNSDLADSFELFQISLVRKINGVLSEEPTQTEINKSLSSKLKIDEWCYDDNFTIDVYCIPHQGGHIEYCDVYYESPLYRTYNRIKTNKKVSLICEGTKLTKFNEGTDMFVATLTADEMVFAGAYSSANYNYYLMNNFVKDNDMKWWSLSPSYSNNVIGSDGAFSLNSDGSLIFGDYNYVSFHNAYSRPAVTLKYGTTISDGDGTINHPYVID